VAVEGEDDVSAPGAADDSQSDASLPSDDDGDADDSDLSETDVPESLTQEDSSKSNGAARLPAAIRPTPQTEPSQPADASSFAATNDTNVMLNGLQISNQATESEALHYNADGDSDAIPVSDVKEEPAQSRRQETIGERKRREHEEYKQKRDQDPAFIPNRGAFFMHDHRSAAPGQNGFRPFARGGGGRGRGRNTIGGPFSPATYVITIPNVTGLFTKAIGRLNTQAPDATSTPWAHDLHDTLQEPQGRQQQQPTSAPHRSGPGGVAQTAAGAPKNSFPVRQFSTTKDLAYVKLRVLLPGMKNAIAYDNTKVRQYTKLPDHRPPLRRDKPVRISLPDRVPAYRWPAQERSFTFIPRALRPNQQGYRGRARLGSMGGFSSRRTSIYGGSVYSPSIPMSRRSSLAREYLADGNMAVSPSGSVRPVVRLPPGSQQHSASGTPIYLSGQGTPVMNAPPHGYPLPQKPTYRENWPTNITMHQPRPQKAVSVAGIESPAYGAGPSQQQQEHAPFQHQLPAHVNGANGPPEFYPRGQQQQQQQQQAYPSQPSGTPLSNIPERAIHAPAFQPQPFNPQPSYQQAAPAYYYQPAQAQYPPGSVMAPMFMPNGQHGAILVPTVVPTQPQVYIQQQPDASAAAQASLVAHEQNGMVYYYNPNDVYQGAPAPPASEGFNQAGNYTMPGMGGMMTPTPDGYYYPQVPQGAIYYPPQ
jgi:hypothetical protein